MELTYQLKMVYLGFYYNDFISFFIKILTSD